MAKVRRVPLSRTEHQYLIRCPGCKLEHALNDRWTFNNNYQYPTFKPALLVMYEGGEERAKGCCHSFITNGQIQFLNDSTHEFRGETLPLPEYEDER